MANFDKKIFDFMAAYLRRSDGTEIATVANPVNVSLASGGQAIPLGQQPASSSLPVVESLDVVDLFQQMLGELRVMRAALVKLACDDGRALPSDFAQTPAPADAEITNSIN